MTKPDFPDDWEPTRPIDRGDDLQDIYRVIEHGTSPESEAVRVLRRFMCTPAGRGLVLHGLLRPFGMDPEAHAENATKAERARIVAMGRELVEYLKHNGEDTTGSNEVRGFVDAIEDRQGEPTTDDFSDEPVSAADGQAFLRLMGRQGEPSPQTGTTPTDQEATP